MKRSTYLVAGLISSVLLGGNPGSTNAQTLTNPGEQDSLLTLIETEKPTGVLDITEVLQALPQRHPVVVAANAEKQAAEGNELAADGVYDPILSAKGSVSRGGYYELNNLDAELRQFIGLWGAEAYVGYRNSQSIDGPSRFPSYDKNQTLSQGELRAGLDFPLWRGGPTDARRTKIVVAESKVQQTDASLAGANLSTSLGAAKAFFAWVAAGHRLHVAERIATLAEQRLRQLEERQAAGSASQFEVTEAKQAYFARREKTQKARQAWQAATVSLSLYVREPDGSPRLLSMDALPTLRTSTSPITSLSGDAKKRLVECHPDVREYESKLAQAQAELSLFENEVAPELNARLQVSRDFGDEDTAPTLGDTNWEAGVSLKFPLALRTARGKLDSAEQRVRQLELKRQWSAEKVHAVLERLIAQASRASERSVTARQGLAAAEMLIEGERYRFNSGDSTLMLVNFREAAASKIAESYVDAATAAAYYRLALRLLNTVRCATEQGH